MAEDGKVVFVIEGDQSQLEDDLDKATTLVAKKTAKWTVLGEKAVNGVLSLGKKAASGVKTLFMNGVKYNNQIEQYQTSFKTMLNGDAEAAEKLIDRIRQFGAETPLAMEGIAKNAQTLYGFGAAGEDVIETLRMLGDAAQGNQTALDSLTLAYAQMTAAGKLNAQDANQMISAGVPIWQMLADMLGKTVSEVREMSAAGQITSETVTAALKAATEEGGKYYQAMQNQSLTLNGLLSTLDDNSQQLLGSITAPFTAVIKDTVLPKANELLAKFSEWVTDNQDKIVDLAGEVGDFVLNAMTWFMDAFKWCLDNKDKIGIMLAAAAAGFVAIEVAVNPIGTAISAVVGLGGLLIANWEEVKAAAERIWNSIASAIEKAIGKAREYLGIEVSEKPKYTSTGSNAPWYVRENQKHASGGIVTGSRTFPTLNSGLHTVGEAGAEAILPLDTLWQHMGAMLDSRLGGMQGGGSYPAAQEIDYARLAAAMSGLGVYLNGERVGELIEPTVSDIQARSVESVQRSGYNGRV